MDELKKFGIQTSGESIENTNGGLYRRKPEDGTLSFRVALFECGKFYCGIDGSGASHNNGPVLSGLIEPKITVDIDGGGIWKISEAKASLTLHFEAMHGLVQWSPQETLEDAEINEIPEDLQISLSSFHEEYDWESLGASVDEQDD